MDRTMPKLLDIRDICALLGISDRALRYWRASGQFPPPDLRCERVLRWREETVLRWMRDRAPDRRRSPAMA